MAIPHLIHASAALYLAGYCKRLNSDKRRAAIYRHMLQRAMASENKQPDWLALTWLDRSECASTLRLFFVHWPYT